MSSDAVAGKHYQKSSPRHKEDPQAAAGDHLIRSTETTAKQDHHRASLNIDHDLDITQLCKAFAEDFTQEMNLLTTPQSSHGCVLMPTCTTTETEEEQPRTESAAQCEGHVDQTNATNMQFLESTACDSGYPTVQSGFSFENPSCSGTDHLHSGFKTANNMIIVIPPEALMKAKAALDESLENMTCTGTSSVTEPTVIASISEEKLPLESYPHGHEAGREIANESVLRSETAAENLPNTFMWQTNESGFKTASNKSITLSSVDLEKAKDIFTELDKEKLDSWLSNKEVQVSNVKDAEPLKGDLKNSLKPSQHCTGNDDESSSLTASQRADVTELCSMLEEAGSQYEFTQFKHTKSASKCPESVQSEKEWDPEILAGIDFDDSFNCDLTERRLPVKRQSKADVHTSVLNSLTNGDVAFQSINTRKPCHISWETPNMADDSLKEKSFCFGFRTAKGNSVTISEKCLSKAKSLFADIEDREENMSDCKADNIKLKTKPSNDHQDKSCRFDMESVLEVKPRFNLCNQNAGLITKETEMFRQACNKASLKTHQGTTDQKADLIQSKTVNFGFSTAGGKEVKISEKALQNAKKTLNEVANDKETKHDNSFAKTKAASWTSVHKCSNVLADVLYDPEMSDGSLPKGGKEQSVENSPDIKQAMSPSPRFVESNGFKMASGKAMSVSASAIQKSKTIFEDIDDGARSSDETKSKEKNVKPDLEGFKMTSGKVVSFSEKAYTEAKTFFKSCDTSQVKGDDASVMDDCGFEAAAGNVVCLPRMDSLNKETLKKDSADLNKYVQRKFTKTSAETVQQPSGCGFSTASGAAVYVSAELLQRAKSMLDNSNAALPGERRLEISKEKGISKNEPVISGKPCGFSTASGRKVAVSEKALQKAKSLFADCDADGTDHSSCLAGKTSPAGPEHIKLSFVVASSKNIGVSEKEPNEGKDVFVSCDDDSVNTCNTESPLTIQTRQRESCTNEALSTKNESVPASAGKSARRYDNMINGGAKADHLGSENLGFSTARGKGVCVLKPALEVAFKMFRVCDAQPGINKQCKMTNVDPLTNVNKTPVMPKPEATSLSFPSQATQDNPSLLSRHSLNLNECTVTQQKYFEQEAMACTKALLEDDLNEKGLLSTLDTGIKQSPALYQERCLEVSTGMRKRPSDDTSLAGKALDFRQENICIAVTPC